MSKVNVYEACDRAIKAMNRDNLKVFGQLKLAKWDELNVMRTVRETYEKQRKKARQQYYEVGFEAYLIGLALCGWDDRRAHELAEKRLTGAWVDSVLADPDPVVLYRFNEEMLRKAMRLAEAIEAGGPVPGEVDKALRYWVWQLGQFAINVTDYAMKKAYRDAEIEKVTWNSIPDEKRCEICEARDGKVYDIDKVPARHPNCRCYVTPVK